MKRVLAAVTVAVLGASISLRAADLPAPASNQELQKSKQQAAYEQERLRREFAAFQQSLLTLAQRYEKSSKAEDREKAIVLRQAIDLVRRKASMASSTSWSPRSPHPASLSRTSTPPSARTSN